MTDTRVCVGCGAPLQSTDERMPGYVPESHLEREDVLCRRCFRIRHYGDFTPVAVDEETYQRQVAAIFDHPGLVLYVVDVFDLAGSLIPSARRFVASSDVIVVVNKVDLLPADVGYEALADWIRGEVRATGVEPLDVAFISAEKRRGVDRLVDRVARETKRPVYVMGMANVGKSTLLNAMVERLSERKQPFTVSRRPGTTLAMSRLEIEGPYGRVELFDTPGLMYTSRVIERLCGDCLKWVVPRSRVRPRVYQLNPGQALFLGGLVRLETLEGERQGIVLYVSNELPVHRTKRERADSFFAEHRYDILKVPCEACADAFVDRRSWLVAAPPRRDADFSLGKRGGDIVLPGLGWIAWTGRRTLARIEAPAWLTLSIRPRLVGVLAHRVQHPQGGGDGP
ncbi:ribosome biogenesis GTPase YqeH [Alicyclobacillus acidocaldarius]|uniref:ribosome biogenesis GTPase YqeH n=1 Tax=Alicyclobacillus acidocaldarius TaxID=405212 RepID=UPI0002F02C70|nr:ribosome biogenesis GTPase YqeH [Alicyclobacillus acidocaldarius]